MAQHGRLELAQLRAGIDAELVREAGADAAQCGQRVGLPAGAVQRQHQHRPQPLPGGMLGDERGQGAHRLGVPTGRETAAPELLENAQP